MKDKPLVIVITLIGGLAASLCCIVNKAGLMTTLISVLVALIVFMIVGSIVNNIVAKQNKIVEEREKEEQMKQQALEREEEAGKYREALGIETGADTEEEQKQQKEE